MVGHGVSMAGWKNAEERRGVRSAGPPGGPAFHPSTWENGKRRRNPTSALADGVVAVGTLESRVHAALAPCLLHRDRCNPRQANPIQHPMNEITTLLRAASAGDSQAADQVVALLYGELHRLARSRMRRSGELTLLDTTALVHESYLRMQQAANPDFPDFPDRQHFLGYAAKVMRTVVVDLVRARHADRRGGAQALHVTLTTEIVDSAAPQDDEILRVHEALDELASVDERLARVVELRYFGGLTEAEIAACLGLTERTVQRDWHKARMFLSMALR